MIKGNMKKNIRRRNNVHKCFSKKSMSLTGRTSLSRVEQAKNKKKRDFFFLSELVFYQFSIFLFVSLVTRALVVTVVFNQEQEILDTLTFVYFYSCALPNERTKVRKFV